MDRHVAFYVHHHGHGHVTRTSAVIERLRSPATVLTSADLGSADLAGASVVRLPLDVPPGRDVPADHAPRHLHYAPLGVPGQRKRVDLITRFIADAVPSLLVVDVSSEVAQLGRLTGTPTVVVRQHGERWDLAHRVAYDGAVGLLAPFGPELEEPDVPDGIGDRTWYAGGLGRRPAVGGIPVRAAREALGWDLSRATVVVLGGRGGGGPAEEELAEAAAATPGHRWVVVGDRRTVVERVHATGWVDDPSLYLAAADVVVGSAGHNTVMEVAAAARPFVCIPQERPFDEQVRKAARLVDLGVAEVVPAWPPAGRWPEILRCATERGGEDLAELADPGAADRAARWLDELAARYAA